MIIDVKRFLKSRETKIGIDYSFSIKDEEIDGFKPFVSDIQVKGEMKQYAGSVEVLVDVCYDYSMPCSRCMEETLSHNKLKVHHALVIEDCEDDGDFYIQIDGDTVNLDELLYQDIILNLPVKYICKDDCRGICPYCGTNLNKQNCSCKNDKVDARLSGLKALLQD